MFLSLVIFIMSISSPSKEITWQQIATTEFDATIITEEDGSQRLAVDISTPEQLAGIFTEVENTYNNYRKANSNNQSKTYAKAKTKKYIAKNISEKDLGLFLASTYINHSDISSLKGTTYRLTNNLNLANKTWSPSQFGNQSDKIDSKKIFDGNGYTISSLVIEGRYRYSGFVTINYGIIKNVKLQSIRISSSYGCINSNTTGYMGGVCARNFGSILNCDVIGSVLGFSNISNNVEVCVGGIVGIGYGNTYNDSYKENYTGIIRACTYGGGITGGSYLGGIAGAINFGATVEYCTNNSNLSIYSTNVPYMQKAGGIVGQTANSTLTACVNKQSLSLAPSGYAVVCGGIAGNATNEISKCINKGNVYAGFKSSFDSPSSSEACAGGIVGFTTAAVTDCKNTGPVKSSATRSISGSAQNFDTSFSVHPKYITAATVNLYSQSITATSFGDYKNTVTNESGKNGDRAYKGDWTTVDNCSSKGKYSKSESGGYAGGIVGYVSGSDVKITSCYNSGAIESNGQMSASYNLNYRFGVNEFTYLFQRKYEYILALNEYISMSGAAFKGGISGYGGTLSKCYTTNKYAKEISISITQTVLDYNQVDSELMAYYDTFGTTSVNKGAVNKERAVTIDSWNTKNLSGFMLTSKQSQEFNRDTSLNLAQFQRDTVTLSYQFPIIIKTTSGGIQHILGSICYGSLYSIVYTKTKNGYTPDLSTARSISIPSNNVYNFSEQELFTIKQSSTGDGKDGYQKDSLTASDLGDSWIVKNNDLTLKCFYWENSQDSSLTLT